MSDREGKNLGFARRSLAAIEASTTGAGAETGRERGRSRSSRRAHFAVFLEFRAGRIIRQRNYDCFEPF